MATGNNNNNTSRSNIKSIGNQTTGKNIGTGERIYICKSNNALQFKTLCAGSGMVISSTNEDVILCSTGGGGGGTITGGTNGLGTDGFGNICLGGTLITTATINNANGHFCLTDGGSSYADFGSTYTDIGNSRQINADCYSSGELYVDGAQGYLYGGLNNTLTGDYIGSEIYSNCGCAHLNSYNQNNQCTSILLTPSGMSISGIAPRTNETCVLYISSGGSLTYGTGGGSIIGGINGLGVDGSGYVCLGGTLATNTCIGIGNVGFCISDDNQQNYFMQSKTYTDLYHDNLTSDWTGAYFDTGVAKIYQGTCANITGYVSVCSGHIEICSINGDSSCASSIYLMPSGMSISGIAPKTNETCVLYISSGGTLAYGIGGGGSIIGATNGLGTDGSGNVCLGGALSITTCINYTNGGLCLIDNSGDNYAYFSRNYADLYNCCQIMDEYSDDRFTNGALFVDGKQGYLYSILANRTLSHYIYGTLCTICGCIGIDSFDSDGASSRIMMTPSGVSMNATICLEKEPAVGACTDYALTWDSGTTVVRKLPIIHEWVYNESDLTYTGQKFAYPTQTIFQNDIGSCIISPTYILIKDINLKTVGDTIAISIPVGKSILINSAKLITLNDASPTSFSVSMGNNYNGVEPLNSYDNLIPLNAIDDVLTNDTYNLPLNDKATTYNDGSIIYFRVHDASTHVNNLCAHLLLNGLIF